MMVLDTILATLINPSKQAENEEKIEVDRPPSDITKIPTMANYVPSDDCPNCPKDFRILDCWQCWQAQGKVCMDRDHGSMAHFIRTTNTGATFCCKQDYNEGYCKDG